MATLQNINISLQAKTISDTFNASSVDRPTLSSTISKTILGQDFSFTVKEVHYNKNTGMYDITGTYDIDSLMNEDITLDDISSSASASDIFDSIVGNMGKSANSNFSGYTPTGLKHKDSTTNKWVCNETYSSALQKLFGWTDIVPSTLVNVFERGSNIYALQRGNESGTTDITGYCGNVVYTWSLLNLLYNSTKAYYLTGELNDSNSNDSTDVSDGTTYLSGQFTDNSGQQTLNYSYGLLKTDNFASTDGTITSTTTYDYSTIYPPANLLSKITTRTELPVVVVPPDLTAVTLPYRIVTKIVNTSDLVHTISNNGKDLVESTENTSTTTTGYNITDTSGTQVPFEEKESHSSSTIYSDMGQGQWSVTTYKDTKITGSQIVTGNPGAKASPYSIRYNSTMQSRKGKHVKAKRVEIGGKFAGNMQINVSDSDTLERVVSAINDLNGRTLEKVNLTYYGKTIIDFLKTITYNGNVYYLESNNISETPDKSIIQVLNMVRWY
jgi:hypothetical protein